MSVIIRVKKDGKYFVASNEPFNDDKLSWEARGVMGYLLSKPDDWAIRIEDLIAKGPAGRVKVERILDELMEAGYINRVQKRREDGTYFYESEVYESGQLNPEYNSQELKERLRKKRAAQAERRKRAYEKKLATLSESPSGPATLSESTHGESVSGESPPLVNTESTKTDSVNTKKSPKGEGKAPAPIPAAVKVYQGIARTYPIKTLWPLIAETVGDDPERLALWKEIVFNYIECGWNRANIKTMLEFFIRGEIPAVSKPETKGHTSNGHNREHRGPLQGTGEELDKRPTVNIYTGEIIPPRVP